MSCLFLSLSQFFPFHREALLAEMGVAIREDGGTLGVFSPKKVKGALCGGGKEVRPKVLFSVFSPRYDISSWKTIAK